MDINANPTSFFNRYPAMLNTTNNAITAINSNNIVYSMPYDVMRITSLPGTLRCRIFLISHGMPSDIKMAKELAPNEFDTPMPPSPLRMAKTLDIPSGMQPPAARNVSPITASGIRNVKPAIAIGFVGD